MSVERSCACCQSDAVGADEGDSMTGYCSVDGVEGQVFLVSGLDAVDGSPVLDIKPALQAER